MPDHSIECLRDDAPITSPEIPSVAIKEADHVVDRSLSRAAALKELKDVADQGRRFHEEERLGVSTAADDDRIRTPESGNSTWMTYDRAPSAEY